jgi:thymidylate kinase
MVLERAKHNLIVEFMGCTAAGKTTVARRVASRLRALGFPVWEHLAEGASGLLTLVNTVAAPVNLLSLVRDWTDYGPTLLVTWREARHRTSPFWAVARAQAAIRLLGERARAIRIGERGVHIVDEGVLGAVHLAFSGTVQPTESDLAAFVATVPLPDLIVWVDAPLDELVDRTRGRPDPPRELRNRHREELRERFGNVRTAFQAIAESTRASGRVIHLWNPNAPAPQREALADEVVGGLCRRPTAWPSYSPQ